MAKKVGVLLSGCGVFDGAEIHEAVLTLWALEKASAEVICMAPDMEQMHVVNHISQEVMDEKRNVLVESARIARGEIQNIEDVRAADLDALIIPGGYGAAKNLSDFAVNGAGATVHPEVNRLLREMAIAKKPIGAICIAPATLTKSLSEIQPEVTIGSDPDTGAAIESMGGKHRTCTVDMIHVDLKNSIVTTPAYMLDGGIINVAGGIEKLVNQVMAMAAVQ